jgi:hypothetical protein
MSFLLRRAAAALLLLCLTAQPLLAQTFANAPIACGSATAFKSCKASFDGRMLQITYVFPDERATVAIYRMCTVIEAHINCAAGEWRSGGSSGPLGGRTIALKDGVPFPQ